MKAFNFRTHPTAIDRIVLELYYPVYCGQVRKKLYLSTSSNHRLESAGLNALEKLLFRFPKGRKSSNFVTILLMKRTRLLTLKKDMFRQLLRHRQLPHRSCRNIFFSNLKVLFSSFILLLTKYYTKN